ncbi:heavy metal-associated isoprenylated plant protein 28 [Cannabis sativa]|uniref:HMA domain-containing protein n=2 Tax=Cannabis sativa TaxID=3483 RepID=A0AB40E671_CANSA|nr:heavy metal-associated isoprenylated plant protein 28 [Cannabis sativa]KAF4398877.1 hypothetical protein G4B88_023471 [Cannabis sativa]
MANLQIVPAYKNNVEAQYVEMLVPLYSYGCERKIKKSLSHLKGIYSVNVDYHQQKVTVWGICNKYDVLTTVKSKRKDARFWNPSENVDFSEESKLEPISSQSPSSNNHDYISTISMSKPSLALTRVKSFSWKAMKKVFTRSHSF